MKYNQLIAQRRSEVVEATTPEPGRGEVLLASTECVGPASVCRAGAGVPGSHESGYETERRSREGGVAEICSERSASRAATAESCASF